MIAIFDQLTSLLQLFEGSFTLLALVFLRVGAMMALLPAAGEVLLPLRLRLACALALTAVVSPALADESALLREAGFTPLHIAVEVIAGLLLGLMLRLLILALQIAGAIIAQSVSLAQMFNGSGAEPQPIFANLLMLAGLALFCSFDGIARSAELVVYSYQLMPFATLPDPAGIAELGIQKVTRVFALGFTLAAPFVIAALLYNLALGAINRAMPGLMVTLIGAPALTFGSLVLLALISPLLLQTWQALMLSALTSPFGAW